MNVAVIVLTALLGLAGFAGAEPTATPTTAGAVETALVPVALVAPRSNRLALHLRRELQASGFVVVPAPSDSDPVLTALAVERAVVVDASGDRLWLLDRLPTQTRFNRRALSVDRRDDLAVRRVCLAVVEHLRAPLTDDTGPAGAGAPADPRAAKISESSAATAIANAPEPPRSRPWSLGAGTAINFDAAAGEPTGHVQLMGETALSRSMLGSVRVHWPLLGAQLHLSDRHVRLWTMGVVGGWRLRLPAVGKRLEPIVGGTAGLRFVLADTNWIEPRQSRVALVPALCAGAFVGLRYQLFPLVHANVELGSEWSRPFTQGGTPYENQAAGARSTRLAIGVSFAY